MEQKTLAKWLKCIILGIGFCGIIFYALVPVCGDAALDWYPEFANRYWPWVIFLWITGVPCYVVLVFAWKIAACIGQDRSFSMDNARYFKWISYVAAGDTLFFFFGNVLLLLLDMSHPGVMLALMLVVFIGVAVTVASAALSHLVKKASELQEQSDLTI
ncbi:MAG: DUF2975 domain-containing protein [Lachnospiraceae bacterium]|nr:DUF2975 domain-containing protein [Lachnospiraceae bacterium]